MDKQTYVVTELAGPKVAGQRVTKGMELPLTAAEAEYELLSGAIVEKGKQLHPAYAETTKKAEKALEAATPPAEAPAPQDPGAPGEALAPQEPAAKPAKKTV